MWMPSEEEIQISAVVSRATRDLLERYSRATGVKKGHLVEQALRHHLRALEELPADFVLHPRVVVSKKSGDLILRKVRSARPTKALRDLMRDGD